MKKGICTKCGIECNKDYTLCTEHWEAWENSKRKVTDYRCLVNIDSSIEVRTYYRIGPIFHNAIRCLHCGYLVESLNQHDYSTCPCGHCSVDGGSWYLKRRGKDYKEMSIYFNLRENERS